MNQPLEIPSKTEITPQVQRAAIEQEFRLAKEYWLRNVHPYIAGRKLQGVELFVATNAHRRLQAAQKHAENWNRTQEGRLPSLDADLSGETFREPEILFAGDQLKPESLAEIASPLMNKGKVELCPAEAIRRAHELLMAAQRYIETLPKQKGGTESLVSDLEFGLSRISFAEVLKSNEKESGRLPLLPPAQRERNSGTLSLAALRKAVKTFLDHSKQNRTQLTEEEYNRATEPDAKLAPNEIFGMTGRGNSTTYQEWQTQADEYIMDCLRNNCILIQDLCTLRWERFKNHWQNQQTRAQKRQPSESKRPKINKSKTTLPRPAASRPTSAGKRQR